MSLIRPKARGLAQRGRPPGGLEESDLAGFDFVRDGRSMPPSLTGPHHLPLSGADLLLNVQKTPSCATSCKEDMVL